jgi:anti-sigma regulatory factor (Ser/Thr protein kinase)
VLEVLDLPADSSSPRRARQFVDQVLHNWRRDGAIERMALIASELVTNAVRHARTDITIEVESRDDTLYLEVFDRGDGNPVFREADPETPGGLGLPIVEALASSWGTRVRDGGKGVWAEVRG